MTLSIVKSLNNPEYKNILLMWWSESHICIRNKHTGYTKIIKIGK